MKVVAISDTHMFNLHAVLDGTSGDVLIHCGDALSYGTRSEFEEFCRNIARVRHKFKRILYTPGNHDICVEKEPSLCREEFKAVGGEMLIHESVTIDGIKIFMSPYVPTFGRWAFMRDRGGPIAQLWKDIPGCDILVTHGPPKDILDWAPYTQVNAGCEELRKRVSQVKPKYHLFGHIHAEGGKFEERDGTVFMNVAVATERYEFGNVPRVFDL